VMRGGTSNLIGLMIPDVRNDFYAEIAQALSETCDREGYRLVLAITGDDREIEARHVRELAGARASGIIIVPTPSPRKDTVRILSGLAHVQLLRRSRALGDTWFGIDDEPSLFDATQHLIKLGHRHIAYIGGREILSTGASRLRGFRRALEDSGKRSSQTAEFLGPTTTAFGASAMTGLLNMRARPTAVVTGSVHITLGLIEAVEKLHAPVPKKLSVIGFGDPLWFQWWRGGLTTIRPSVEELATTCGLWFLSRIRAKNDPIKSAAHKAIANSTLIVRANTRPP